MAGKVGLLPCLQILDGLHLLKEGYTRLTTFFKAHEGYLSAPVRHLLHPVILLTRSSHKYSFLTKPLTDGNSSPSSIVNI